MKCVLCWDQTRDPENKERRFHEGDDQDNHHQHLVQGLLDGRLPLLDGHLPLLDGHLPLLHGHLHNILSSNSKQYVDDFVEEWTS